MNSILLFALVLAVAGGAIAYIGDRLGTYVGKRRMSVIGLRPRHTAMLYTICSGSAIAVLTLLALVLSNQAFRRALVEGPHLIFENNQYRKQISIEQRTAAADLERAQLATAQLAQTQSQLQPVQRHLASAQRALGLSQKSLLERQGQLSRAEGQLAGVRASLVTTNNKLLNARQDIQTANQSLGEARRRFVLAQNDVQQQQTRVRSLRTLGRQLVAQQSSLAALIEASRQDLIYHTGQEVGRVVIKTDQPVNSIENELESYLDDMGREAEQRGGKHSSDGRAVVIAVPAQGGDYKPLDVVGEKQAVRTLAQNIAGGSGGSVVVLARAVTNTFLGEQTGIDLYPYDNVLIYPKNAVVASRTISGAQTEPQLLDDLQRFLTEQVKPAVGHQGLIPESDPQTGKPVLGAIDGPTSLAVVHEIEQIGADAHVTAYVGEDTYSSGPLHLRLRVAPVAPVPSSAPPSGSAVAGAAGWRA